MSYRRPVEAVEDYTNAFLATLWVLLFMSFWAIAVILGFIWVAVTAYGLNAFFKWIGRRIKRD